MKKTTLLLLAAALISANIKGQTLEWVKQMRSSSTCQGYGTAVDASGNVYTTGGFLGTVDFDPGAGVFELTSAGYGDVFVSKLDASGNFLWAVRMGGAGGSFFPVHDTGNAIALDGEGNVYITGWYTSASDFDPGPGVYTLTPLGDEDIFVCKLSASGNFVWAKSFGGADEDIAYSIALNGAGEIFIAGHFGYDAEFGSVSLESEGFYDAFVAKLDAQGNAIWAKNLGGTSDDFGTSLALDNSGNIYVAGYFFGTVDFDPGAGVSNLTSDGAGDAFLCKLDSSGNFVWAKRMGGTKQDSAESIVVDNSGNVCVSGRFKGVANFGSFELTVSEEAGTNDSYVFVSKLDGSGNFIWAKQIGGNGYSVPNSIAVDIANDIYITGNFLLSADFDPGDEEYLLSSCNSTDIFICKLNYEGNFVWAVSVCGSDIDEGNSIAVDAIGNIYTTGLFREIADFDPGEEVLELTVGGGEFSSSPNVFVHKMTQPPLVVGIVNHEVDAVVFPNPANSFLNIQSNENMQVVSIYNLLGDLVQTETRNSFSIENLPVGVYMVHIKTQNGTRVQKVVKE